MSNHLMPDGFDVKICFKKYVKICQPNMKNHLKPGGFMSKYVIQICKAGGFDVKICFKNMLNKYVNQVVLMHCQRITLDVCLLSGSPKSKYSIYASPISFDAYI